MSRKHVTVFLVFVVGVVLAWGIYHWQVILESQSRFEEIKTKISNIPTPEKWYLRDIEKLPMDPASVPQSVSITFGDQPTNDHGDLNTTTIIVTGESLNGRTPEQWIDYRLSYWDEPTLNTATSAIRVWGVQNGRFIIGNVSVTPAGGYTLSYYLFDNGVVYMFVLEPSPFVPGYQKRDRDIINSPNAKLLRATIKQFADNLPSVSTQ